MQLVLRRTLAAGAAATAAAAALVGLTTHSASAVGFTGGDLVVYRVGDGVTPLSNAAAPVFLDTYDQTGASTASVALPTADGAGQHALTSVGFSTSEGQISRSPDGRFILLTGYDAAPGTFGPLGSPESLAATPAASVGRTIGVVDGNGQSSVDTSTVLTTADAPLIVRSATSTDGVRLYATGGNGGVLRTFIGSAAAPSVVAGTATSNLGALSVQDGQLFADAVAGPPVTVGNGVPTAAGAAVSPIDGLTNEHLLSGGYTFFDLATGGDSRGFDTLYVADAADRAGSVKKYSYSGGAWVLDGATAVPDIVGLTAVANAGVVSIAATTTTALWTLTDTAPADAGTLPGAPVKLADAPAGTEFRGVALAPLPASGPSIVVRTPTPGQHVPGSTTKLAVAVDVASPNGVGSVSVRVDSAPAVAATHGTGRRWTASLPVSQLAAGNHTVHVTALDQGATPASSSSSQAFTLDPLSVPAGDIGPGTWSWLKSGITHSSSFSKVTFSGAPGGSGLKTTGKGTVTFTYYGRGLALHLGGRSNAGKIKVTDAGKTTTVDLYRSKSTTFAVSFGPHSFGAHKVTISAPRLKSAKSSGYLVLLGWLVVTK